MRTSPLSFLLLLTMSLSSQAAAQTTATAIPISRAKARFDLARRLADTDGGRLWKVSLNGPMLFVDPATREVVANQADKAGQLRQADGLWIGSLPPEVQPSNTSLEWAGTRWTMVIWGAIPNSAYEAGRLLMHESFHRVQPEVGFSAESPGNAHLDNELGRAWMRLEMRALAEAMIRTGEQRRAAARHALLFRAVRQEKVGSAAAREEAALEINEGICEYTGLELSGLPRLSAEQRIAVDLERRDASPTFTRSFAYATGPAICFLLDEYKPDWRTAIVKDLNLATALAGAVEFQPATDPIAALNRLNLPRVAQGVTPAEAVAVAAAEIAVAHYDGQFVFDSERTRATHRAARLVELRRTFVDGPVLRIEGTDAFRFSFDPNAAESLDEKRIVYRPVNTSDEWGILEAPEGGLIDFNPPMSIVVPIPSGATPESVPWKLTLKPGFRLESPSNGNWRIVRE